MESIFLVLTSTAICIFKYPFLFFICHFSLIHCPLLVTLIPVLSTAMMIYSSFNSLFLLSVSFILMSNLFILLCLLWYNGEWKVLFLSHGLVQFPLRSVYKEDESMPWHNQVKGEMYQDNEMVP